MMVNPVAVLMVCAHTELLRQLPLLALQGEDMLVQYTVHSIQYTVHYYYSTCKAASTSPLTWVWVRSPPPGPMLLPVGPLAAAPAAPSSSSSFCMRMNCTARGCIVHEYSVWCVVYSVPARLAQVGAPS
jgi:hypothetical protein